MKKLLLSLMAAGVAVTSFAHGGGSIHPGDFIVYGNAGVFTQGGTSTIKYGTANSNTTDNNKYVSWNISPGIGYNLTDHITLGLDGFYRASKNTTDRANITYFPSVDQTKGYGFGIGAFGRYTQSIGKHFFTYGQLTSHYLDGRQTRRTVTSPTGGDSYTADDNYKGFDVNFYPALGVNIACGWAVTAAFGGITYEHTKWDYSTQDMAPGSNRESTNSQFYFTFGQQFNFGVQKTIGCRSHKGHAEPMDDTRHMDTSDDESDNHKH